MFYTYLVGSSRTATDGQGTRYHALEDGTWEFGTAICGARPGRRSNGWSEYRAPAATCPKCLKKLAAQRLCDHCDKPALTDDIFCAHHRQLEDEATARLEATEPRMVKIGERWTVINE